MTHGDKCETRNMWGYVTIPVYEYDSLKEAQSERAQLAAALKNVLTLGHRRDHADWTVLETRAGQNAVRLLEGLGLYEDRP